MQQRFPGTAFHLQLGFGELELVHLSQGTREAILVVWFSEQVLGLDPQSNTQMSALTAATPNFKVPGPGVASLGFGFLLPKQGTR